MTSYTSSEINTLAVWNILLPMPLPIKKKSHKRSICKDMEQIKYAAFSLSKNKFSFSLLHSSNHFTTNACYRDLQGAVLGVGEEQVWVWDPGCLPALGGERSTNESWVVWGLGLYLPSRNNFCVTCTMQEMHIERLDICHSISGDEWGFFCLCWPVCLHVCLPEWEAAAVWHCTEWTRGEDKKIGGRQTQYWHYLRYQWGLQPTVV